MLSNQMWMRPSEDIAFELLQAEREGRALTDEIYEQANGLSALPSPEREPAAHALYEQIQQLPMREDWRYCEPDHLEDILRARPVQTAKTRGTLAHDTLFDKIYGAWLGRCCGCLLGQPVESWYRERIVGLLEATDNLPINRYLSSDLSQELRERFEISDDGAVYGNEYKSWINNVSCMPEDDDVNYTVLALKLMQNKGFGFTPEDVAEAWLSDMPLLHTCSAERVAYINFANLVLPPASAVRRNPYREWIGAQIRGDLFGYVNPGNPKRAAELAWRDASISHVKNGIYGEMFVSAMLAEAFFQDDPKALIRSGLSQIPANCRLSEAVMTTLNWHNEGVSMQEAIARVHKLFDEKNFFDWCHVIPNAMIVCCCLLLCGLDFEKGIGSAVEAGFDTDCNAATVGSVLGLILGARALPEAWVKPLADTVHTGVHGLPVIAISELALRTCKLAEEGLAHE